MDEGFKSWDTIQVGEWLNKNGFKEYCGFFIKHQITGELLLDLDFSALKDIGVLFVGDRARILTAIKKDFAPKQLKAKSVSNADSPTQPRKKSIDSKTRRAVNISTSSGALKSKLRDALNQREAQSTITPNSPISSREYDSKYDRDLRNRGRSHAGVAKPLVIFPRSSSIKNEKPVASHQQLVDALDSVFGSGFTPTPGSSGVSKSMEDLQYDPDKDVMDMKNVREECIRVYGQRNQSHVIKVAGLQSPYAIKTKILQKFSLPYSEDYQIFIKSQESHDAELLRICQTDNEFRGVLYLRKIGTPISPSGSINNDLGEGAVRSMQKISKFFGIEGTANSPISPRSKRIASKSSKAVNSSLFVNQAGESSNFFGERPPDELIVDQLEQFFPGIAAGKEKMDAANKVKSIVQANLIQKRTSRRASSLMLRRLTNIPGYRDTIDSKLVGRQRPQAILMKPSDNNTQEASAATPDTIRSDTTKVESLSTEPQPISFRWVPGRLIGQGAFGKVFHALNLDTGDFMAVKQVLSGQEDSQQKKSNDSLQREIELLSELNHDNIVRYFEYVAGGSIASVLQKCGKLDENISRSFSAQILCGLEYLHSRDIIHRDIKGANSTDYLMLVLVTGDGVVKISDFGISKKNEYTAYHRMTRMSMQGSIHWMAPEVARGKGYSAKVDIWSCGCLVLEMLTGQVPWHKVRGNIIYLLGTGNSPPLPPSLSEVAKHFLEQTFEIDPEKRPTATVLLNHVFTDVDLTSIDFFKWSTEAMQLRAEMGSTSEEPSTSESDEHDSDVEDDDEDYDEEALEDFTVVQEGAQTPTSRSAGNLQERLDELEGELLELELEDSANY